MSDDPYRWLEDVTGERALSWARVRNAETVAGLTGGSRFEALRAEIREVLDSTDRIPYISRRGEYRYNFWRDREHPRGLWRRTTLAEYRKERPNWEILLDVDALARDEGESWVYHGAQCLWPDYRRALVSLSRGGADAAVVREFDIERREFVTDGFALPEAKSGMGWIDVDHIYVATDFGPGTLTTSGYPRTVRQWRRGTRLAEAELVYEGKPDDISVSAYHHHTEGFERDFVRRSIDFYRRELYQRCGDRLRRVEVPDDALVSVRRQWLLIELRSEWTVGQTYPAGCLLAADFDDFMALGGDTAAGQGLRVLFSPDERTSLAGYSWTRNHLIVNKMQNVVSQVSVLTPDEDWRVTPLASTPPLCTVGAWGTDADIDDEYLLDIDGYLTPSTLAVGTIGTGPAVALKRAPSFFDSSGLVVSQHFAVSDDGTRIPYFVVAPDSAVPPGGWPTLLYGYGGFEVSLQPGYGGARGRGWLARGGCYVLANIRGGGEYGPRWHSAALKRHRHLVYEDFAAVARDLVTRGLTTPPRLGAQGGSNGGLLMGVMLTRYPELFGAIVAGAPLLDMLRYHQLLAGASWTAEYGDPDDPAEREYLLRFSPYHQLLPDRRYPPTLVTTSTRDDRVHPGHARKLVARMREYGLPVTYYENIEGGHGGAANNEQAAFMSALAYEFLWRHLSD
ncbi:MAG: prolyl oligopeptidase family serine peptidase [Actinomycetota bacterium]|nr:prolyl oligopeptidase family serine peptidase [Actinomycetota bacterium]